MTDRPTLESVQLIDMTDAEFWADGERYTLTFERDGVWTLSTGEGDDDTSTVHRKPDGSWEITREDGQRHRQGPDWRLLVEHHV